MIINLN